MLIKEGRAIPYSLEEDFSKIVERIYDGKDKSAESYEKKLEQKSFDF